MAGRRAFALPLRYAWRSLRRAPVFTMTAALTLALGVGATTAIFSVVNAVLLRPLPYDDADRLVAIGHTAPGVKLTEVGHSLGTYFTYRKLATAFDQIGLYKGLSASLADPTGRAEPERLNVAYITPSVLPALRVSPIRGRRFQEEEGIPGGVPVVLLADDFWRRRFGGDPTIVGKAIQMDGRATEVIGVMPPSFHFPDSRTEAWLPLRLNPAQEQAGGFDYSGIARLRSGATAASGLADIRQAFQRLPELYPTLAPGMAMRAVIENARIQPTLVPLRDVVVGSFGPVLWVVAATAGLVLLVACANIANLLLVRAEGRQKELTVRSALGAGHGQVLAHFFAEGVVLALLGGVIGTALAVVSVRLLVQYGPAELPRLNEVRVDLVALAFAALASLVAALLATLFPAFRQGKVNLGAMLREGGRSGTAGRQRQRTRGALVSAQVALALVLLSASGLLARSVLRLKAVRPGFDAANVLTLRVDLPRATYPKPSDAVRFFSQLVDRVATIPGVRAVSVTSKAPLLVEGANLNPIAREDRPPGPNELPALATFIRAGNTYFQAMGIPMVAGRSFGSMTEAQSPFEVVISRKLAREQWGDSTGASVIGARVKALSGTVYTVIGVAETVLDSSLAAPPTAQVYFPVVPAADTGADNDLIGVGEMSLVVRTTGDPNALVPAVRREVAALDRTLPIFNLRAMDDVVASSFARLSFTLMVLAVAAGATLFLGAVGLYGVVAYVVSLRTKEIGVRIALGAPPRAVGRLIARQGVVLAMAGAAVGLVLFGLLARLLRSFLFEVSPVDPLTLGLVTTVLILVAAGASWLPARRAARIDPVEAMRSE